MADVIRLSVSESTFNVHTLILPIHPNQRLNVSTKKVDYMRSARAESKQSATRLQEALWHGYRSGHEKTQGEIENMIGNWDIVHTVMDEIPTIREQIVMTLAACMHKTRSSWCQSKWGFGKVEHTIASTNASSIPN